MVSFNYLKDGYTCTGISKEIKHQFSNIWPQLFSFLYLLPNEVNIYINLSRYLIRFVSIFEQINSIKFYFLQFTINQHTHTATGIKDVRSSKSVGMVKGLLAN